MDVWDEMFSVNVKGVMMCNKEFGKRMKANGYGKIIDITSVRACMATFPMKGNAGYCATKGALNMVIRQCAAEFGPEVTVNGIGPTVTMTPMMVNIVPEEAKAGIAQACQCRECRYPLTAQARLYSSLPKHPVM